MTTRSFHIGDILTITTGLLVSPRHIAGVYDILNWMTGDNLFTHQLGRATDECKPHLLAQHPDLAAVEVPDFSRSGDRDTAEAAVKAWLTQQVAQFGETRPVAPLTSSDHTSIDPLTELAMNHPGKPVIAVNPEDFR